MQKYTFNTTLFDLPADQSYRVKVMDFEASGSNNVIDVLENAQVGQPNTIEIDWDSKDQSNPVLNLMFEVWGENEKEKFGISASAWMVSPVNKTDKEPIPSLGALFVSRITESNTDINIRDVNKYLDENIHAAFSKLDSGEYNVTIRPLATHVDSDLRTGDKYQPKEPPKQLADTQRVMLSRTEEESTPDEYLWYAIEERTRAIGFDAYSDFLNRVFCEKGSKQELNLEISKQGCSDPTQGLTYYGTQAYELLKDATDCFLMQECGTVADGWQEKSELNPNEIAEYRNNYLVELAGMDGQRTLPYFNIIREKLAGVPIKSPQSMIVGEEGSNESSIDSGICYGILPSRMSSPCMTELIWSYWMEEMGLKQAWNLISLRFQNRKVPGTIKLARMEMDPLRPLNNLLWGYVQHEGRRLTIPRRAAEYMHAYGLHLKGKAIANLHFSDTRKSFLQAFHTLLNLCHGYYMQDDDATIHADAFPVLNGLREVHLLLAEGLHNQAMDLTWTARAEAMMEQWMMTLPPMRDFLGGRVMVPYSEPWMDRMDTMKNLMDWNQTPSSHFRDLAVYGEQILLSVRFGNWTEHNDAAFAANWLKYWRSAIQRYMHAYRAVTGVDLTRDGKINATPPAELIEQRMAEMKPAA